MKVKLVISKYETEEDEFIASSFGQYKNVYGYWVFYLVVFNLGVLITPMFLTKSA